MKNGLRTCHEAADLSQGELAEAVGTTRQTINTIEHRRYGSPPELAFKLAAYFDCHVEDPFGPELGADLTT